MADSNVNIEKLSLENIILRQIIDLDYETGYELASLKLDRETFLKNGCSVLLEKTCNILDAIEAELFVVLDEKGNMPDIGEVKIHGELIYPIAYRGFTDYNPQEQTKKIKEMPLGPGTYVLEGNTFQVIKNESYIREFENRGIFRKNYWGTIKDNSGEDIRNTFIPIVRKIDDVGNIEVPAFANFGRFKSQLKEDELITEDIIHLARGTLQRVSNYLYFINLVNKLYNTNRELEKSIEEREILAGLANIGSMAGEVSHNLRNYITIIHSSLNLAKKCLEMKDIKGGLEKITACFEANKNLISLTERFATIMPNVSDYTRLYINKGIEEILKLDKDSKPYGIEISVNTDFDTSIGDVYHSPSRMSQIYLNLLLNSQRAIKEKKAIMDKKGISYKPEIRITTRRENDKVKIIFYDNGIGIPEEDLSKVFDIKFTTKQKSERVVGVGLSNSYKFMKDQQGGIEIKSKEGEHTEVILTLPY